MDFPSVNVKNSNLDKLFWYDYFVFIIVLGSSIAIGIYFGCFGSKQKTLSEYLLGNKKMKILPVAFSIAVGNFSAITILGVPSDTYKYGAFFLLTILSTACAAFISVYVYLVVYFDLQLTTVYEYLEKRFDYKTRLVASTLTVISGLLYMPIIAYTPALAISTATGTSATSISTIMCIICIFYTTIGGLKTVIWTDLLQFAIILISLVVVAIIGISQYGFVPILSKAYEGGRLDIFDFDADPTKRDSFWSYLIGYTLTWTTYVTFDSAAAQKFLTLPTYQSCKWVFVWCVLAVDLVIILCSFIGFLIYVEYSGCDPQLNGKIEKHDQLGPLYITALADKVPGILGLFLATLLCASLSSLSSLLNALSGIFYKDIVSKFLKSNISEARSGKIVRLIVAVNGIICISLVFVYQHYENFLPLSISVVAVSFGPVMGMFTLGVLIPRANSKGAFYGALVGFIAVVILVTPMKLYQYDDTNSSPTKKLSTDECLSKNLELWSKTDNVTVSTVTDTIQSPETEVPLLFFMFRLSHVYHVPAGAVVTIIVGLIISYCSKRNEPMPYKSLINPLCHWLLPKSAMAQQEMETVENLVAGGS